MGKRVIVGAGLCASLLIIFLALPPVALPIFIALLSMVGIHEVLWGTHFVQNRWIVGISILFAGLVPFWVYTGENMWAGLTAVFVYFVAMFAVAISSHYAITMEKLGVAFFFSLLIPLFLASFIRLDQLASGLGKYVILVPLVVAFSSDAFALFAGMAFGKHKLAPELSPKKTREGAVGGLVGAVICLLLYGLLMERVFGLSANYPALALCGGLGAVVSQMGDLSFSYIKRQNNIKDFGKVFPGHGGVLDRFDSVIFCAPLIELLVHFLSPLGV